MSVTVRGFASDWSVPGGAKAKLDEIYPKKTGLPLNAKDWGAVGDGVTDDTAAVQSFVTHVAENMAVGVFPKGHYRVSAPIVIPMRPGWALRGVHRESVKIIQAADNVPVFDLGGSPGSYLHSYELEGFTLTYANFQPSTNAGAITLRVSGMPFQGAWRGITFERGYYGNYVAPGIIAPWGHSFDDLHFDNELSGGAINWADAVTGIPNNVFGRLHVDAKEMTKTIFILRGNSTSIAAIEIIAAEKGPRLFEAVAGCDLDIGALRIENGVWATGTSLFFISVSSYVRIGVLSCSGHSTNFTGGTSYLIHAGGSGGHETRVDIGFLDFGPSPLTNGARVYALSGSNIHVKKTVLGANATGLVNAGASATGETCTVADYVNGRLTSNRGDVDYTATLGSPNRVSFQTPFTAPRTISLPLTLNSLLNGLYYEFVFDGAINGANTVTVKAGNTTKHVQRVDKVVVGFTYRRHPSDPGQGWTMTKHEVLPGGTPTVASPDGTLYRLTVGDGGTVTAIAV